MASAATSSTRPKRRSGRVGDEAGHALFERFAFQAVQHGRPHGREDGRGRDGVAGDGEALFGAIQRHGAGVVADSRFGGCVGGSTGNADAAGARADIDDGAALCGGAWRGWRIGSRGKRRRDWCGGRARQSSSVACSGSCGRDADSKPVMPALLTTMSMAPCAFSRAAVTRCQWDSSRTSSVS